MGETHSAQRYILPWERHTLRIVVSLSQGGYTRVLLVSLLLSGRLYPGVISLFFSLREAIPGCYSRFLLSQGGYIRVLFPASPLLREAIPGCYSLFLSFWEAIPGCYSLLFPSWEAIPGCYSLLFSFREGIPGCYSLLFSQTRKKEAKKPAYSP